MCACVQKHKLSILHGKQIDLNVLCHLLLILLNPLELVLYIWYDVQQTGIK